MARTLISSIRSSIWRLGWRATIIRAHAIAAAAATFNDSAPPAQGDRHPGVAGGQHLGRQPLPLGTEADVAAPASEPSPSPPWATRATRGPGVASTPATVAGGRAKSEPMLARAAFGE